MSKINNTTDYASVAPASGDHVIGTDVSNTTNDANGETVTFTMANIATYLDTKFQGATHSYVLEASAVAASHTGSTTETVLKTVTVPAGAIGANGFCRVCYMSSHTNNANSKTFRIILDSQGLGTDRQTWLATTGSPTSNAVNTRQMVFYNQNSESSQVSNGTTAAGEPGGTSVVVNTMTIDTSLSFDIDFTGQLNSVTTDTIGIEYYIVEIGYLA